MIITNNTSIIVKRRIILLAPFSPTQASSNAFEFIYATYSTLEGRNFVILIHFILQELNT